MKVPELPIVPSPPPPLPPPLSVTMSIGRERISLISLSLSLTQWPDDEDAIMTLLEDVGDVVDGGG